MKFNLNALKGLFGKLAKSGMADDVAKFAANYGDDVALGALDVVDDIPTSIAFDDIADSYMNRIPIDKSPITPSEFVSNYKAQIPQKSETRQMLRDFPDMDDNAPTELDLALLNTLSPEEPVSFKLDGIPDYNAMDIRPERFGATPSLKDSVEFPDGFTDPEDFANYYDSLERGYITEQAARPSERRLRNLYNTLANGGYSENFPDRSLSDEIAQAHKHYYDYFNNDRGDTYGAAESFQKLRDASMRAIRSRFKF